MTVWIVNEPDLILGQDMDAVFSTKEKAIEYIKQVAKYVEAEPIFDTDEPEWGEIILHKPFFNEDVKMFYSAAEIDDTPWFLTKD
jgi:hypothetical protein